RTHRGESSARGHPDARADRCAPQRRADRCRDSERIAAGASGRSANSASHFESGPQQHRCDARRTRVTPTADAQNPNRCGRRCGVHGGRQRTRDRPGGRGRAVKTIFHDQARWYGAGTFDQSFDHSCPRGKTMVQSESGRRSSILLRTAGHNGSREYVTMRGTQNTARPTIFVVDDDAAVRDALKLLLRSVGQAVETFASAQEFLDAYSEDRPGCLVLDIRMPGMSRLELRQKLNEKHSILPII